MCHGYFFFQPPDAVIYLNSPSIYGSASNHHTVWTVNDVLVVDPYFFTAIKGYGSTKIKKGMDQPGRH